MTAFGDPQKWADAFQTLHERVIENLAIAWPRCVRQFDGKYVHEQKVTNKLVVELRKASRSGTSSIPARIEAEYTLLNEISTGDVNTKGYVDMALLVGDDDEVYVAYESKWLNVPVTSGGRVSKAREYVLEGLARYVREQYATNLPRAYMLGYVFDNDISFASRQLEAQISLKEIELDCVGRPQWILMDGCPDGMERRLSEHGRTGRLITIEHLLMKFNPVR